MHELSIAMGIVAIAKKEAEKAKVSEIKAIDLEIGTLSGVEIESLNFVWSMAVANSVLEHAEKRIHTITSKAICLDCNYDYDIENYFDECPKCGSHLKNIYQGKEMRVKSLEV